MKQVTLVAVFLGGALIAASFSAIAQAKQPSPDKEPNWAIGVVDEGSIRTGMIGKLGASKPFETKTEDFIKERDEATDAEVGKQTDAFLKEGYEPYSAAVYGDGNYSNEKVWFYRKRMH